MKFLGIFVAKIILKLPLLISLMLKRYLQTMHCFPLSENTYSVDQSKIFIPFNPNLDNIKDRPASLIVDICPFLILTPKDKIVIDPGLGLVQDNGEYHIINNLHSFGIDAAEISIVLLSHLHKDHFGGAVKQNKEPMFPRARYYVQQGELEYALSKESRSYEKDKIQFLLDKNYFVLLQGNGEINNEIKFEVSGGHTPYHQVFNIRFDDEKYFYGGDVLPQAQQLQRKFIAKYDYDGKLAADLRIEYGKYLAAENITTLYFHSTSTPMSRVRYEEEKFLIDRIAL
jgi:glyoxylase-like metal-dependent hydrolase (beta-lactamase superfamily II)